MKFSQYTKRVIGSFLFIFLLITPFLSEVNNYLSIPKEIITFKDESIFANKNISTLNDDNSMFTFDLPFYTDKTNTEEVIVKAASVPVKKIDVSYLDNKKVIVGGQSVGIQLHTLGVLVVGHHLVNHKGRSLSPGEDAQVQVGDIILEMNGHKVNKMDDVKPIVEKAGNSGKTISLKIKRDNKIRQSKLTPVFSEKEKSYQIGLYIRDSATGIGTISFYDPETQMYGALGHIISDVDTKKPIQIYDGKIVNSTVTNISKGNHGYPGEKQAKFSMKDKKIGSITKNSAFGIFGKLKDGLSKDGEPISIALSHDVEEGPAQILTVVEGNKVEQFDIEIINSIPQKFPATKGMVIKVTDEKLLDKTGGIVQGMSGSPIIQNGKLIGAVTHVFVNDPTSGYGVHIEWMLNEAGIDIFKENLTAS